MPVKLIHSQICMLTPLLHQYIEPGLFIQHEAGVTIMGVGIIEVDQLVSHWLIIILMV